MDEVQIRQRCRADGLEVADLRHRGDILVVVPASLDRLPAADVLAGLADSLRQATACRYVTFAIDEHH